MTDGESSQQRFERMTTDYKTKFGVSWQETMEFYAKVGQAISFWSYMETRLVQICARLLGSTDERAGVMLYSIMNFHTWLNIIDDLFNLTPAYKDHKTAWGKESAKLRSLADTRNRLAHHTLISGTSDLNLKPGPFDVRTKTKKNDPLTGPEIFAFIQTVYEIQNRLSEISRSLPQTLPSENSQTVEAFGQTISLPNPDQRPGGDAQ